MSYAMYCIVLFVTVVCSTARRGYVMHMLWPVMDHVIQIYYNTYTWAHFIQYRTLYDLWHCHWHDFGIGLTYWAPLSFPIVLRGPPRSDRTIGDQRGTYLLGKGIYVRYMLTTKCRTQLLPLWSPTQQLGREILLNPAYYYFNAHNLVLTHDSWRNQAHKNKNRPQRFRFL